jgi:predicted kinase
MAHELHPDHPVIILIRGLPGSGKTYIAMELQKELGQDVIMLDPDATDYESKAYAQHTQALTAEGVDPKLHAYRFLRAQAYQGIADHKIIMWNQPFTNLEIFNKMTANLRLQAEAHKTSLSMLVVEVMIDPAHAQQRVRERKSQGGHGPSDATFSRFVGDYKTFANEGYTTVTVHGEDNVSDSVAKIIEALQKLLAREAV